MPKALHDFTIQESIAPYIKAVAANTTDGNDASRAVHMTATSASVSLTVNGAIVAFWLIKGHTYSICATKASDSGVVFLY